MLKNLEMPRIRMMTERRIAEYSGSNLFYTSGAVKKPTLSYNSTTKELTVGEGIYRSFLTTDYTGVLVEYTIGETILQLQDNMKYYVAVKYNNGNPIAYAETDPNIANDSDVVAIYTIFTEDDELDVLDWGTEGNSLCTKLLERLIDTNRYGVVYGFTLSATNLNITIGGGQFYLGSNKINYNEINSTSNLCELIYRDGLGGYEEQDILVYPNTQYDNGTGTLATLTDTHYGTIWVYKSAGNPLEMYAILGTESYANLELAKQAKRPSEIPEKVASGSFLCGVIIFQKGSTTATVLSAFDTVFNANAPSNHASLLGLQGGIVGEFYHMSLLEYTNYNKLVSTMQNSTSVTLYNTVNDVHSIVSANGFTKLNLTLGYDDLSGDFTYDAINKRLVYVGSNTKLFLFDGAVTLSNGTTNNTVIQFKAYKNGNIPYDKSLSIAKLDSSTDYKGINSSTTFLLNQNDYIEIFASSDKNISFTTQGVQLRMVESLPYTFNN